MLTTGNDVRDHWTAQTDSFFMSAASIVICFRLVYTKYWNLVLVSFDLFWCNSLSNLKFIEPKANSCASGNYFPSIFSINILNFFYHRRQGEMKVIKQSMINRPARQFTSWLWWKFLLFNSKRFCHASDREETQIIDYSWQSLFISKIDN